MADKKYFIKKPGTGFAPHMLVNADDQGDFVALCSCGGTHNEDGTCDGTHNKKKDCKCDCEFCKPQEQRVKHI